ncbi:Beta-glucosidase 11, partial [Linum grandiflorum]
LHTLFIVLLQFSLSLILHPLFASASSFSFQFSSLQQTKASMGFKQLINYCSLFISSILLLFLTIPSLPHYASASPPPTRSQFPPDFFFGAAISAYQTEGAATEENKGQSIWDIYTHQHPGTSNGDVAADSYHLYKNINLLAEDITKGDYRDYVDVCFKEFGDRVKHWITLNEPHSLANGGYSEGTFPPGRCTSTAGRKCDAGDSATEPYIVGHNQLLAHAAAVQLYRKKYQASQKGMIGITLNSMWYVPTIPKNPLDVAAVATILDFVLGWMLNPIVRGEYPKSMRKVIGERLPKFTPNQVKVLKGSIDFLGVNYYTSNFAGHIPDKFPPNFKYDAGVAQTRVADDGKYVQTSQGAALQDPVRIYYLSTHLSHLDIAMKRGANVKGYFTWSLIDNFEWGDGYTMRYGLQYVDFNNSCARIPKQSALWFKKFMRT